MKICIMSNALSVHGQRWASAYAERGHEVFLLSIRHAEIEGVEVQTVCIGPVNSRSIVWTFLSYVRMLVSARWRLGKLAPDVLHAHYTVTYGVIAAFSGFHPWALSAWGSDVICSRPRPKRRLIAFLNRCALWKADLISATSQFLVERLREFSPVGKEILHIPFGVNPDLFSPVTESSEQEWLDEFRIGFVKTLKEKYGPEVLLRAMPEIIGAIPHARLIMAGRGPLNDKLRQMVDALGLGNYVEFSGFVPNAMLPQLMRTFDVFVNCSVVPESFGVVILEASACGLPVVATRVGGVSEACIEAETALLVEPNDKDALANTIIRLEKDPALRKKMGEAGRAFVLKNYVWQNNVDRILKHFEKLIE